MDKFKAFRINEVDKKTVAGFVDMTLDDLDPGEATYRSRFRPASTRSSTGSFR